MNRSANEVSGLVAKAARGAGLPLGLAEDLALALPAYVVGPLEKGLQALVAHLADPVHLLAQTAALDRAMAEGRRPAQERCPCLAAVAALHFSADVAHLSGPLFVPGPVWDDLERWAARTYVPATEASRQAGAGAGLTDND